MNNDTSDEISLLKIILFRLYPLVGYGFVAVVVVGLLLWWLL